MAPSQRTAASARVLRRNKQLQTYHNFKQHRSISHKRGTLLCSNSSADNGADGPACHGVYCYPMETQVEQKQPIRIAVTGASGQIANHLVFSIASGEVFGPEQPVELRLHTGSRYEAVEGVCMELEDSVLPLLRHVSIGTDSRAVFDGADWALLIGAKPRRDGMRRADLLEENGQLFRHQGYALAEAGKPSTRVLTVGNPVCSMALVASECASSTIPKENFFALSKLDENRAKCQLAIKAGVHYDRCSNLISWGNHSSTLVPDWVNARIDKKPAYEVVDESWLRDDFTPRVQNRGAAVIKKWGRSSGASTAIAIMHSIHDISAPTPEGQFYSLATRTEGNPYGIPEGLVCSMPCRTRADGTVEFVPTDELHFNDWLNERLQDTTNELLEERNCVQHLIGMEGAACNITQGTGLPGEN